MVRLPLAGREGLKVGRRETRGKRKVERRMEEETSVLGRHFSL